MCSGPIAVRSVAALGGLLFAAATLLSGTAGTAEIAVLPEIPRDLNAEGGGAPAATLEQAAAFAWQEFIALNWPALQGKRDVPAKQSPFDAGDDTPRVWETFRGRVEVYPGAGKPYDVAKPSADYGYDARPQYRYDPEKVASAPGVVPACPGVPPDAPVPWHNLDELNQQNVRSGLSPGEPYPGGQILIESKVNRAHYLYVASRGWYGENSIRAARKRTGDYVRTHLRAPPPAARADEPADTEYISFPTGAIEVKGAWRRLGSNDDPREYYRSRVRYYREVEGRICYVDSGAGSGADVWGLVGLHIMHKTPSAPYFIWATFEHANSIVLGTLGPDQKPIAAENPDGSLTESGKRILEPYTPDIEVVSATETAPQKLKFVSSPVEGDKRLYFYQEAAYDIPEMKFVAVNRRLNPVPEAIVKANRAAQAAIARTSPNSPFRFYRLISVQWVPLDKSPGAMYSGPHPAGVYYAANATIEAPPVHQRFSGQFSHGFSKSSDYVNRELPFLNPRPNPGDPVFFNTFFGGKGYLSGGCMGCHGFRQAYGTDWSFLLDRQRVRQPELRRAAH